jgi:hypothetical protein
LNQLILSTWRDVTVCMYVKITKLIGILIILEFQGVNIKRVRNELKLEFGLFYFTRLKHKQNAQNSHVLPYHIKFVVKEQQFKSGHEIKIALCASELIWSSFFMQTTRPLKISFFSSLFTRSVVIILMM